MSMKQEIPYPNIRNIREENNLSQAEMAKILNCTQSAYCHYEVGNRDMPTKFLIAIADYFCCSTDYLLGRSSSKKIVGKIIKETEK